MTKLCILNVNFLFEFSSIKYTVFKLFCYFQSACQEFCVDNSKIYIDDFEDDIYDEKRHKIRTVSTIGLEDYVSGKLNNIILNAEKANI